ncbi:MAG: hypothetical protein ACLUI3_08155 [Christensenellales bacterium]
MIWTGRCWDTEALSPFWVEAARQMGYPMEDRHALMVRSMAAEWASCCGARSARISIITRFALRRQIMEAYIDENGGGQGGVAADAAGAETDGAAHWAGDGHA